MGANFQRGWSGLKRVACCVLRVACCGGLWLLSASMVLGATNNLAISQAALPNVGSSILRLMGALGFVCALFLGGVWLYRNWQRLAIYKGRMPKLNILEVKSLGSRHALYLVGYEQQRFLISSSPAGINLLAQLPEDMASAAPEPAPPFLQSLQQALATKP